MVNCPLCRKESKIVLVKNTEFRIGCDADDDDVGTAPGADADKNQSAKKLRFD
jgi:hypothetical protein